MAHGINFIQLPRPGTDPGFARSGHMVRNKLCWKANNAVEEKPGWTGKSPFILKVPLRYLSPSIISSVPCELIVPFLTSLFIVYVTIPTTRAFYSLGLYNKEYH